MVELTDPRELLEVYTPEGLPTGRARPRGLVHLEGDWHLAFFCWVARPGPHGPELLLQHRGARKDVFPLHFDASAAGHVRFGETLAEAAREVREELGIDVELADLIPFGRHRQEHDHANGLIDREYHALHLLTPGPPDAAYAPDPREVAGLAWVNANDLVALVEGEVASIPARYRPTGAPAEAFEDRALTVSELVPYAPGYHRRLVEQIGAHV
ncbi:MAG: NUDIX domain-containing protein [Chloroflexi bacterium]|nr:NUDIX domain-containing protein [Chloroflexota bacterium]